MKYKQGWQDHEIERMERTARKFGRGRWTVSELGSRAVDAESVRGRKVARGRLRSRGKGKYPRAQSSRGRSRYRAKDGISTIGFVNVRFASCCGSTSESRNFWFFARSNYRYSH